MDKPAKVLLNSLKCPICNSQIDILDWSISRSQIDKYNFGCVDNYLHYRLWFTHWEIPYLIEKETVTIFNKDKQFEIKQYYYNNNFKVNKTEIYIRDIDQELRVLEHKKYKFLPVDYVLFDFSKSSESSILTRIKTLLYFQ